MLRRVMMAGASGQAWSPDAIFAVPGTAGFWLDPYDMGTLFQDAAGTVPVAADGDPVGLVLDKSGNGIHAVQPAAANRPLWRISGGRCWLEGNASSRWMYLGATAEETNYPLLYLIARVRTSTPDAVIIGKANADPNVSPWLRWGMFRQLVTTPSVFNTLQTRINGAEYRFTFETWPDGADATPVVDHPSGQMRIGSSSMSITNDPITYPNSVRATLMQAGNSAFLGGQMRGLVGVARAMTSAEKTSVETWMGGR